MSEGTEFSLRKVLKKSDENEHPYRMYKELSSRGFSKTDYVWGLFAEYNDLFIQLISAEGSQRITSVYKEALSNKRQEIQSVVIEYDKFLDEMEQEQSDMLRASLGLGESDKDILQLDVPVSEQEDSSMNPMNHHSDVRPVLPPRSEDDFEDVTPQEIAARWDAYKEKNKVIEESA